MKKLSVTLILIMCMTASILAQQDRKVTVRILGTTDIHGAFFPYNFTEQHATRGSMARISSYVKRQRSQFGNNLIVVDNGDILQGQPVNYYANFISTERKNVAAEVLNYIGYDAAVFGNHDIEPGHAVYDKWVRELDCPVICANMTEERTGKPYTKPYVLFERDGVRIALLGMLTPAIPNWLHQSLWSGVVFEELTSSVRRWVDHLRSVEHADVIVGVFHSGWQGGITTDDYEEDATRKVTEQIDGIDAVIFGHDHREFMHTNDKGIVCMNPSTGAVKVAQLTLTLSPACACGGCGSDGSRMAVVEKRGELVDITGEDIDADYMAHFEQFISDINTFVNRPIGRITKTISSHDAFFGSAAFTDMIHRLQLNHTGADISFNAPLVFDTQIKAGIIHMSDMFKLYKFENSIYTIQMTGAEIHNYLEMSYRLWTNTMKSADDHIMLLDNTSTNDNQRSGFKNYTFNFDSAAGIDYEVDVTKPAGQKVKILKMSDGRPFSEDTWYKVAMNSYRANGGGDLLVRGAGIPADSIPGRITYMSERDQRYYLTQWIESQKKITPEPLNNWRFVPDEWTRSAIVRDRKIIFHE